MFLLHFLASNFAMAADHPTRICLALFEAEVYSHCMTVLRTAFRSMFG
jgi:hypothetical protein